MCYNIAFLRIKKRAITALFKNGTPFEKRFEPNRHNLATIL